MKVADATPESTPVGTHIRVATVGEIVRTAVDAHPQVKLKKM
jgi:hypothetical protein